MARQLVCGDFQARQTMTEPKRNSTKTTGRRAAAGIAVALCCLGLSGPAALAQEPVKLPDPGPTSPMPIDLPPGPPLDIPLGDPSLPYPPPPPK